MKNTSKNRIPSNAVIILSGFTIALLSFVLGRMSTPQVTQSARVNAVRIKLVQDQQSAQELIPLPGPGSGSSQRPEANKKPNQPANQGECPVYIYQDGKLFKVPTPSQKSDQSGGSQELIPLEPNGVPNQSTPGESQPNNPIPSEPQPNNRS